MINQHPLPNLLPSLNPLVEAYSSGLNIYISAHKASHNRAKARTSQPRPPLPQNLLNSNLARHQNTCIPQATHPMPVINLLILLTREHIPKMLDARIMRERNLIPVTLFFLPLTLHARHVPDDFRVAAVPRADGLCERGAVLEILAFHARIEGEQVEHGDCAFCGGAGALGEGVDPGGEGGGELERLAGVRGLELRAGAAERRYGCGVGVQQRVVRLGEVLGQPGWDACCYAPVVFDELGKVSGEVVGAGEDEEDVPFYVLSEQILGGDLGG